MWILVRGIRVDHGARACPQSHDDHVRRDCHYVRRDCNPSDPMWVARLHGGVARLRPSPLYVHRARVRHPHTSICHVPRSLHSPWGYEPPGIPHSRRQLCRGRFSATGTSSSRCAYPTARPVAIRPLCDNSDKKKVTVALGMGAPGNWHSHYFSRGGTQSWAKLHRPLRALAQSPLRPRQTTCPQSDGARHPPTPVHGVATQVRKPRNARRQTLILEFTNPGEHVAKPCQPSLQT